MADIKKAPQQVTVTVVADELTFGELEELEEMVGHELTKELLKGEPGIKAMKAFAFLLARRDNPDVTLAAISAVKPSALMTPGTAA